MNTSFANESHLKLKKVKKGSVLFSEGDEVSGFYILQQGRIRLLKSVDNRLISLGVHLGLSLFGETEVFLKSKRVTSAIVEEDTSYLKIDQNDVNLYFQHSPQWIDLILQTLSKRLTHSWEIIKEHQILSLDSPDATTAQGNFPLSPKDENHYRDLLQQYRQAHPVAS